MINLKETKKLILSNLIWLVLMEHLERLCLNPQQLDVEEQNYQEKNLQVAQCSVELMKVFKVKKVEVES